MLLMRSARTAALAGTIASPGELPPPVAPSRAINSPEPWRTLFDGTSLDAWRGYKGAPVPAGWHIVAGTLAKDVPVADIVTKDQFADFELELEWKIGDGGNSGIFYRGAEEYDHIYWSGPEYQPLPR